MEQLELVIDGMGCGGCIKNVRKALENLVGVAVENVAVGSAVVSHDPAHASRAAVVEALAKAGYPASVVDSASGKPDLAQKGGHCAAS